LLKYARVLPFRAYFAGKLRTEETAKPKGLFAAKNGGRCWKAANVHGCLQIPCRQAKNLLMTGRRGIFDDAFAYFTFAKLHFCNYFCSFWPAHNAELLVFLPLFAMIPW